MIRMLFCPEIPRPVDDVCRQSTLLLVVSQIDTKIKVAKVVPRETAVEVCNVLEKQYSPTAYFIVMSTISPFGLNMGSDDVKIPDMSGYSAPSGTVN